MISQGTLMCILLSLVMGNGQVIYSRAVPLEAVYGSRRIAPRSFPDENIPSRMRVPFERYFPQVDTQAAPAPAQPYLRLAVPAASLPQASPYYWLKSQDLYALPPQWTDGTAIQPGPSRGDEYDYGTAYEYDEVNPLYPSYDEQMYVQEPPDAEEDLMGDYMLSELRSRPNNRGQLFNIRRRSEDKGLRMAPIPITSVIQANAKQNGSQSVPTPPTVLPSPNSTEGVSETPSGAKSSLPPPFSSVLPPATAPLVPPPSTRASGPSEAKPSRDPHDPQDSQDLWRTFSSAERGQKEFPLYRPAKTNHQSAWYTLEEQLSRAKDSDHKGAIPLLKKLIGSYHSDDPLTNQLTNLKLHKV